MRNLIIDDSLVSIAQGTTQVISRSHKSLQMVIASVCVISSVIVSVWNVSFWDTGKGGFD